MTETLELEKASESLLVQAEHYTAIVTTQDYIAANNLGLALKAMVTSMEEYWEVLISDAHKHHKALVARKNEMTGPAKSAIAKIKILVAAYDANEEKKRQEDERAAAEALRNQAEAEALETAAALQAAGDRFGAEQTLEAAINAPAPPVIIPSAVPTITGKSSRQNWKFRITDADKIPREYLMVDEQKIGAIVRALKEKHGIPGIQAYPENIVSFRG
jgi:hypothetical protein